MSRFIPALIEDWHKLLFRSWTNRIALFWGGVCGLYAAWPALQYSVPPILFALASVLMCMGIVYARVTKQPGVSTTVDL